MKNFLLYFLFVIIIGEIGYLYFIKNNKEAKVLAVETTVAVPTATSTPTETPVPTIGPTSTPKPTAISTSTPLPQPKYTSEEINGFIERFAAQYNVSPHVLRYIATCESGFRAEAYKAGYAGLFQFGSITWKNIRSQIGEDTNPDLRYNAEEAVQTAAYAISVGKTSIWPNCAP